MSVYVHWSVLAIAALILINAISRPITSIVALLSYLGVILLHECGHMYAAQRLGCHVHSISLFPLHGRCVFDAPWNKFDHCVIAWGGFVAQAIVFVPLVAWMIIVGYTDSEPLNAMLAIFGGFSLLLGIFNLIPAAGLDGKLAWAIFPEYLHMRRRSRPKYR